MSFLDGGAYDNCSVEMLYDAGYKNIIAIKLFKKRNRIRNYSKLKSNKDLNLNIIVPSEELPFILNFETKTLNKLLKFLVSTETYIIIADIKIFKKTVLYISKNLVILLAFYFHLI